MILKVYPRAYGGNQPAVHYPVLSRGLSPCIRGKRNRRYYPAIVDRSIPVHTGETLADL